MAPTLVAGFLFGGNARSPLASAAARVPDSLANEYPYVDELPRALASPPPIYPADAFPSRAVGSVVVRALVEPDGRVSRASVARSCPAFDDAAVAAIHDWVFEPARTNGEPVAVWVGVTIRFAPPFYASARVDSAFRSALAAERDGAWAEAVRRLLVVSRMNDDSLALDDALHQRLIEIARNLRPPQPVSPEAVRAIAIAESVLRAASTRPSLERALVTSVRASVSAPWWAKPYGVIASAQRRLGRREQALRSLELERLACSSDSVRTAVVQRMRRWRAEQELVSPPEFPPRQR